jgi:hypothetical protein
MSATQERQVEKGQEAQCCRSTPPERCAPVVMTSRGKTSIFCLQDSSAPQEVQKCEGQNQRSAGELAEGGNGPESL